MQGRTRKRRSLIDTWHTDVPVLADQEKLTATLYGLKIGWYLEDLPEAMDERDGLQGSLFV